MYHLTLTPYGFLSVDQKQTFAPADPKASYEPKTVTTAMAMRRSSSLPSEAVNPFWSARPIDLPVPGIDEDLASNEGKLREEVDEPLETQPLEEEKKAGQKSREEKFSTEKLL